jgi:hypothetical protein
MALSEDYLSLYTIDQETGHYLEYSASEDYASLGFGKEGEDFFRQGIIDGRRTVDPEDLPRYLEHFNRENVLREIRENGFFSINYRLVIGGEPLFVRLKAVMMEEKDGPKLIIGVPVGFVNVIPSKELIIDSPVPCIVARGRKGGSNVAACIVNALLYALDPARGN